MRVLLARRACVGVSPRTYRSLLVNLLSNSGLRRFGAPGTIATFQLHGHAHHLQGTEKVAHGEHPGRSMLELSGSLFSRSLSTCQRAIFETTNESNREPCFVVELKK